MGRKWVVDNALYFGLTPGRKPDVAWLQSTSPHCLSSSICLTAVILRGRLMVHLKDQTSWKLHSAVLTDEQPPCLKLTPPRGSVIELSLAGVLQVTYNPRNKVLSLLDRGGVLVAVQLLSQVRLVVVCKGTTVVHVSRAWAWLRA